MAARPDKSAVLDALRVRVAETLDALTASQKTAHSGAIHEETRQEDPKDTRAIEATYLARGLAERVETLRQVRASLACLDLADFGDDDPIGPTALVGLRDEEDNESIYFLVAVGGGERLSVGGMAVQTITPQSPLGESIAGRSLGDEIEVYAPGANGSLLIAWLA